MEKEINDIDDLIGKVLAGESSAAEKQRLDAWIAASQDNQKYFESIRTIFEKAASNSIQLNFDTDAAWNKVKSRLHETREVKLDSPLFNRPLFRIAASIIFFLGVGLFAYTFLRTPAEKFAFVADATTAQDTLPDGSIAFLNKRSSIHYESASGKKPRKVKLKGEGFFEIKHEETRPFVIEADEVLVKDIGTSFNVKAYPESDTVEVAVKTGEVQFYTLSNVGLDLKMGETGIYSKRLKEFTKLVKADTNTLAYKTGVFSFNNTDLRSIINKINEVYDSNIRLDNPALGSCQLTVNFNGDTVDTIVEVIAETLKLTVAREGNEILLKGTGCNQ